MLKNVLLKSAKICRYSYVIFAVLFLAIFAGCDLLLDYDDYFDAFDSTEPDYTDRRPRRSYGDDPNLFIVAGVSPGEIRTYSEASRRAREYGRSNQYYVDIVDQHHRASLYAIVANTGNRAVRGDVQVVFYRSDDAVVTPEDTPLAGGTITIEYGLRGRVHSPHSIMIPTDVAGTHYYGACVEVLAEESNTKDNCATVELWVYSATNPVLPPPVLEQSNLFVTGGIEPGVPQHYTQNMINTIEPIRANQYRVVSIRQNQIASLYAIVHNVGKQAIHEDIQVLFYRSDDAMITPADTLLPGGIATIEDGLGSTVYTARSVVVPTDTIGTYYYGACAVVAEEVYARHTCTAMLAHESHAQDSCVVVKLSVRPAPARLVPFDLVPDAPRFDVRSVETGSSAVIRTVVRNIGDTDSVAGGRLRFYREAGAEDVLVATVDNLPSISAGAASQDIRATFAVNGENAPVGENRYYAVVDRVAGEKQVNNNTSTTSNMLKVTASDLVLPMVVFGTSSTSVAVGDNIPVAIVVENRGDADSNAGVDITLYREAGKQDVSVLRIENFASVPAGSSRTASGYFIVSESTAPDETNSYYAVVSGVSNEARADNNTSPIIQLSVTTPTTSSVRVVTKNNVTSVAAGGSFQAAVRIDGDSSGIPAVDLSISFQLVDAQRREVVALTGYLVSLPQDLRTNSNVFGTFTVPSHAVAGNYYLQATAVRRDGNNSLVFRSLLRDSNGNLLNFVVSK